MSIDFKQEDDDIFIDPNTGDFALTNSDTQHVKDIIESWAGWYKQFPTVGVGAKGYLGRSGSVQFLKREIKVNLKADGYRVDNITIDNQNEIYVTGERIKNA